MKAPLRNQLLAAMLLIGSMAMAGCVHLPAPSYQPGISNTEMLLRGKGRFAVARFDASKGTSNASLGIRGSGLTGGSDGSFSTYLQEAIVTELETAGRHDPASGTVIGGTLVRNTLDGGSVGTGKAVVGARFVVIRDGIRLYDKSLEAEHTWDSSFIGALAIPAAMQNYAAAVQKLIGMLFGDAEFNEATKDVDMGAG